MFTTDIQFQTTQNSGATFGAPFTLPISTSEYNYGILNLKSGSIAPERLPSQIHFIMTCDRSGSMGLGGSHGTKMDFLKQTLRNMVRWLSEQDGKTFYLTIIAFDDKIEIPLEYTKIESAKAESIVKIIDKLYSRNSTDIELALKTAQNITEKYKSQCTNQAHVFMTDGEITKGSSDTAFLKSLIDETMFQSFIGYGTDHNVDLLKNFSTALKSDYYFVESVENTGMVYGEIVHKILNNIVDNVKLTMHNGVEVYNFNENTWTTSFNIGSLPCDADKMYHLRYNWSLHGSRRMRNIYTNPLKISFDITYSPIEDPDPASMVQKEAFVLMRTSDSFDDFHGKMAEKYVWRLKTLMHLYETANSIPDRRELGNFLKEMQEFMERHDIENDAFMKNLCDDIYISIKSSVSHLGNMYISARQTSQGQQRAYNMTDISGLFEDEPSRAFGGRRVHFNAPFENYQISMNNTTPYIHDSQADVMRTLSQPY